MPPWRTTRLPQRWVERLVATLEFHLLTPSFQQRVEQILALPDGAAVLDIIAGIALKHDRESLAISILKRAADELAKDPATQLHSYLCVVFRGGRSY